MSVENVVTLQGTVPIAVVHAVAVHPRAQMFSVRSQLRPIIPPLNQAVQVRKTFHKIYQVSRQGLQIYLRGVNS